MPSRRAQRRSHGRTLADAMDPDAWYGTQPAWAASKDDLPQARKESHDLLVLQMGETRTGPVRWLTYEGEAAHGIIRELGRHYSPDSHQAAVIRQYHAHLREYGGFIVVAAAEGKRPEESQPEPSSPEPEVPIVST